MTKSRWYPRRHRISTNKIAVIAAAVGAAAGAASPLGMSTAHGATRFYVGADNANWNTTASWSATANGASGQSVPVASDIVNISGVTPRNVNFNGPNYLTPGLASLTIDGNQVTTMTLTQALANNLFSANEIVGLDNIGTHTHSLGSNTVTGTLTLAANAGSTGSYNLSGGTLNTANVQIGVHGLGTFTHTSGTHTSTGTTTLAVNSDSAGSYILGGGTFAANTVVNNGGFLMNAGVFSGTLKNFGQFSYSGGTFNGTLEQMASGVFNPSTSFTAGGGFVNAGTLNPTPSTNITANGTGLTNNATINMQGGSLSGSGPQVNNAFISGFGTFSGTGGFTNNGSISQTGGDIVFATTGTNTNFGSVTLGSGSFFTINSSTLNNSGLFELGEGLVNGTGTLANAADGIMTGPGTINATFSNAGELLLAGSGGVTRVTNGFTSTGLIQLSHAATNLTGGTVVNSGTIQGVGKVSNAVTNNGVIEANAGGTLMLSGTTTNNAAGIISATAGNKILVTGAMASNAGLISLAGGNFETNNQAMTNNGNIAGYGTIRTGGLTNNGSITFTGGNTVVNGNVTNNVGKTITAKYAPTIFTGNVVNNGTFKSTSTSVTFLGSYTGNTYISDPSDNFFQSDVTVNNGGFMLGDAGDRFFMTGGTFTNNGTYNVAGTLNANVIVNTGSFTQGGPFTASGNFSNSNVAAITGSQSWGAGTTLTTTAGMTTLGTDAGTASTRNLSIVSSGGVTNLNASEHVAAITASNAARINLAVGKKTIVTNSVTINNSAKLDISNGNMVVQFGTNPSPLASIRTMIRNGRGGTDFGNATWNGPGGITSAAAAPGGIGDGGNPGDGISFAVGYVENSFLPSLGLPSYTSFGGQTVDSGSMLIRFTRGADCNLDGKVNTDDVTIVGALYNNVGSNQWFLGDFDFDGICDTDDVTVLGALYDATAPALSSAELTSQYGSDFAAAFARGQAMAAVPEPSSVMLLAASGALLARRRARSRCKELT